MKVVLPIRVFPWMVKLRAEPTAMPYPNAPVRRLPITVPDWLMLLRAWSPNHVRGPIAMPILEGNGEGAMRLQGVLDLLDDSVFVIVTSLVVCAGRLVCCEATSNGIVLDDSTAVVAAPWLIVDHVYAAKKGILRYVLGPGLRSLDHAYRFSENGIVLYNRAGGAEKNDTAVLVDHE